MPTFTLFERLSVQKDTLFKTSNIVKFCTLLKTLSYQCSLSFPIDVTFIGAINQEGFKTLVTALRIFLLLCRLYSSVITWWL